MKNDMPNIRNYRHIFDQIYYKMNFITSSSISLQDFPALWDQYFLTASGGLYISEYVCKTCLKESGIFLKCRETFEKCLAACNSSKNTGLTQFFFKVFWQLYFKNINFLTKTKRCILCWLLWIQNYQINWQFWQAKPHFLKK